MPSVGERLTVLEPRMHDQAAIVAEIRGGFADVVVREIRRDMDQRFQLVDHRFQHVDQRFQQIDQRFQQVEQRFVEVDRRFGEVYRRFDGVDRRFDRLERIQLWTLGVMLTGFAAVMTAILGIVFRPV
jgi:hypothetical protein